MNEKYITDMQCMLSQNFQNNLLARFCKQKKIKISKRNCHVGRATQIFHDVGPSDHNQNRS